MSTEYPMYRYWPSIPWHKLERKVYKLQKRIYKASQRGNVKLVHRLQRLLTHSQAAKYIAVRRITQDNQGRKTAGVDGVRSLSPAARIEMVTKLKLTSKAKPVRRVWIPKPGKTEKRPLGIPTMSCRCLQALLKMAIEPEWEAQFEPNSYGFRPGRSCHDAIGAIYLSLKQKSKYILDADIKGCFDNIHHQKLLSKLNTTPTMRRVIRSWLKAGVIDGERLFGTEKGVPQGGAISPLLANIALHGLENRLKEYICNIPLRYPNGRAMNSKDKRQSLSVIRYADDFVIMHANKEIVEQAQVLTRQWLEEIGLSLHREKTTVVHSLSCDCGKPGFNFLGFHIRQYAAGKHQCGVNSHGDKLQFKTNIRPSKESIKAHYQKLKNITNSLKGISVEEYLGRINPIILGWSQYYSRAVSSETFGKLDFMLNFKVLNTLERKHRRNGRKWALHHYYRKIGNRSHTLVTTKEGKITARLARHTNTSIKRHIKVRGSASPYDGNLIYWATRMGMHPEMPRRKAMLLKKQQGKCLYCGLIFQTGDVLEIDHKIPRSLGGKDEYKNLQLLHRHCHDEKTVMDFRLPRCR